MPIESFHITFTFGLLLVAALLGGVVGEWIRAPKVTSYLLMGVVIGPTSLNWLPAEHVHHLEPFTKLAMALVLFNLGCRFSLTHVRRLLRRVLSISTAELSATFVLVSGGLLLAGASLPVSLLLGALALATAPATTILVLQETRSEGVVTRYTEALVALNNLACILIFECVFLAVYAFKSDEPTGISSEAIRLVIELCGATFLGMVAGLITSYFCSLLTRGRWMVLLVSLLTLTLGLCEMLKLPYLLTFLAMGATVVNTSDRSKDVVKSLGGVTAFLCVLFFIIHGAELKLSKFVEAGLIGGVYISARMAGKYAGVVVSSRNEDPEVRTWLGATLMSQAGAAISLSVIAVQRDRELGLQLQTIILGSVVFFEIAGPLLVRQAVVRAGEVPLVNALHHTSSDPLAELQNLISRILVIFGYNPLKKRAATEITVKQLMRKNVKGISDTATFNEIVSVIEHSHDETYPVIAGKGELVGIIRYRELSNTLFDPHLGSLVRAADLATFTERIIYPDESVARAWEMIRDSDDDCIPVVSREERNRLEGIVRRRDLVRMFMKDQQGDSESSGH